MKYLKLLLLACVLAATGALDAQQRTAAEAAAIAADFVGTTPVLNQAYHGVPSSSAMRLVHTRLKNNSAENAFYVFNNGAGGGFVIVSADERTAEDVLGYSDKGSFDIEHINPNFRFWLERYTEEITAVRDDQAVSAPVARKAASVTAIAPLLGDIAWDQEAPYYNLCPIDQLDNTRCLTGCVATAASQVMFKWRHPMRGTGSKTYTWEDCMRFDRNGYCTNSRNVPLSADFGSTTYDWDNMLPTYGSSYTTAQGNAVATLMYQAGVACEMMYGGDQAGGSGAYTDQMGYGLITYFGYKLEKYINTESASYYYSDGYTPFDGVPYECSVSTSKFIEYFNADLEAGRPIIMGGSSASSGGHEFVCDGRDTSGKFHINWGWSGDCNGYFALTSLRPSGTGYNFSSSLDAIIGLQPNIIDTVHVTGVSVSPSSLTVNINGKQQLTASVTPSDATLQYVTWTSSNDNVAAVSASGVVRGMGAGSAVITATTAEGDFTATCTVTVTSEVEAGADFSLLTSLADLEAGDEVIIVCASESKAAATLNNQIFQPELVEIENNAIVLEENSPVAVFTVGGSAGAWTFANSDGDLLGATALKKLAFGRGTTTWSVSLSGSDATIQNGNSSYGRFLYNVNSPRFTTYTSNTSVSMLLPQLFIRKQRQQPTALSDSYAVRNTCVKTIENGQVVIVRDGVRYNVLGQIIR